MPSPSQGPLLILERVTFLRDPEQAMEAFKPLQGMGPMSFHGRHVPIEDAYVDMDALGGGTLSRST